MRGKQSGLGNCLRGAVRGGLGGFIIGLSSSKFVQLLLASCGFITELSSTYIFSGIFVGFLVGTLWSILECVLDVSKEMTADPATD